MHFLSSCGCFSSWFIAKIKRKKFSSEYVMKDRSLSLHKLDCILATESHRVNTTGNQYIYGQNIRSHNGCNSFIYFRTSGIYTLSLKITVPRKIPIAKIWGLTTLNTSFMTQLGPKVLIFGICSQNEKYVSLSVMPGNVHTYTSINTLCDVLGTV